MMKSVRIAALKAHLSEHLRAVRRGHSVTVLDRDEPIARIVPYKKDAGALVVRKALRPFHSTPLPPPLDPPINILELLFEERQRWR